MKKKVQGLDAPTSEKPVTPRSDRAHPLGIVAFALLAIYSMCVFGIALYELASGDRLFMRILEQAPAAEETKERFSSPESATPTEKKTTSDGKDSGKTPDKTKVESPTSK